MRSVNRPIIVILLCTCTMLVGTVSAQDAQNKEKEKTPKTQQAVLPDLPGASVAVPWSELRGLLERAGANRPQRPPVEHIFSKAVCEAKVADDRVTITAVMDVTTLGDHWTLIPLGPAELGIVSVTADGEDCPIVLRGATLHTLFAEKGKRKLQLTIDQPVTETTHGRQFQLPLMPVPLVSLSVAIPGENLVAPSNDAAAARTSVKDKTTEYQATFRGGRTITVAWKPYPSEQQPAKRFATTDTLVAVRDGVLHCRARVTYEILQAPVDRLRIGLPDDVELLGVTGPSIRRKTVITENKRPILVLDLKDLIQGEYDFSLDYIRRFDETEAAPAVPLITHPDAETDRGAIGVEVRANYEVDPKATGLERIDVKELPGSLWENARSPLLLGYRYTSPKGSLALAVTRHEDLDVLVAMSDVCEATTVVTPDGKCITKMMFIVRNNLKPFMTLTLPKDAQLWSALVDDRPVTPARNNKGEVLIPLKKSDEVDEDDEKSYRARRERRRSERLNEDRGQRDRIERRLEKLQEMDDAPRDLKPYDVEIVFIHPKVKLAEKGEITVGLPQCDVPTGQMAWAVFLPRRLRVVDSSGNMKEVGSFSLPFRHFGEAEYLKQARAQQELAQAEMAQEQLAELAGEVKELASAAKAPGVLPVRIEIPITGEIYRLEKFLVVDEAPEVTLMYRRRVD